MTNTQFHKIAVLMGGRSAERPPSRTATRLNELMGRPPV